MKKFVLPLFGIVIFYALFSCKSETKNALKPNNTFTLSAHLEGLKADYLLYYEKDNNEPDGYRRDTLIVKNQKFTFTDSVDTYKSYFITVPEANRTYTVKYGDKEYKASVKATVCRMWFIGYPGAEITYTGKVEDFMVNAYPSDKDGINDDLAAINSKIFPLINKSDSIQVAMSTLEPYDSIQRKSLGASMDELSKRVLSLKESFIKNHPQSIAATYVFQDAYYRNYFNHEASKAIFNNFDSTKLAGVPFYDEVKLRLEAVEKTGIGMQAPELITTNTLDGSEFKLSSLKGNYVLFDYWGTWCGPCMAEMPKIKEYANKYSDKNFVVVGVNSGDTAIKWKKAIEKNDYNWTHIQTTTKNNLLIPFNVNSFPTKILLDPEGKIIYSSKNTEAKVDLYEMLDTIFKNN